MVGSLSLVDLDKTLQEAADRRRYRRIDFVKWYAKQREFFALGREKIERMLNAGNRLGKSEAGGIEITYHLTGKYPDDWPGRRWDRAVTAWACGLTGQKTMEISQGKLCGDASIAGSLGTGFIPKEDIVDTTLGRGTTGAYASIVVQHYAKGANGAWVKDGLSKLQFKAYEQGWQKMQGEGVDIIWLDEEPDDYKIYTECRARLMDTGGMMYITFTPLNGETELFKSFQSVAPDATPEDKAAFTSKGFVNMTGEDVLAEPGNHFFLAAIEKAKQLGLELSQDQANEAARAAYDGDINSFPLHERDARRSGRPIFGSGSVFAIPRNSIEMAPFIDVPGTFRSGWGVDFGGMGGSSHKYSHPFGAVLGHWDPLTDIIYIQHALRIRNQAPIHHAAALKLVCAAAPVFWPHDGHRHTGGGDENATTQGLYKIQGLRMFATHATFKTGGYATETGILDMHQRFTSGRLKVCSNLLEWWEEFIAYHRDERGEIVKVGDDLMSATRILCMMLPRFGVSVPMGNLGGRLWKDAVRNSNSRRATGTDDSYFGYDD